MPDPSKQYQLPRRFGSHAVSSDGRWMYNETDEGYALFDIDTTDEPALIERLGNKAISWIEYSRDNRYFTVTRGDTKESWLLDAARPIAQTKDVPEFLLGDGSVACGNRGRYPLVFYLPRWRFPVHLTHPARRRQSDSARDCFGM